MSSSRHARVIPAFLAVLLALVCAVGTAPAVARATEGDQATYSAAEPPELYSTKALLIERETNTTLYDIGADERAYPASLTKVMTALVVLENADLDDEVTVEEADFDNLTPDSSVAGLRAGETLTVRDLLACLLVPSGNDASYVLARYVGDGDWHAFVDMMNKRAEELGCKDTHFANPCGLHEEDHYTTARDLVLIFEEALTHPEFVEAAGSLTWDLPATSQNPARTLESTDMLLDPESSVYMNGEVVASKTGTTAEGGRCLITEAQRDGRTLVGVTLGAPMDPDAAGVTLNFYDMQDLLNWGFGAWRTGEVVSVGDVVSTSDVTLSSDGDEVDALASSAIVATVPTETTLEDLTLTPSWEGELQAPLDEGAELGEVSVALGERDLGTVTASVARSMALSIPEFLLWWLSDPVHMAIVVVLVAALLVTIGLVSARRSRERRRRRQQASVSRRQPLARSVEPSRLRTPGGSAPRRSGGRSSGSHMRR